MGDTAPDACEGCADLGVCRGACDAVLHPTDAAPAGDTAALVAEAQAASDPETGVSAGVLRGLLSALADALERAEGEVRRSAEEFAEEFAARGRAEALLEYGREARQLAEGRASFLLDEQQRAVRERNAALARAEAAELEVRVLKIERPDSEYDDLERIAQERSERAAALHSECARLTVVLDAACAERDAALARVRALVGSDPAAGIDVPRLAARVRDLLSKVAATVLPECSPPTLGEIAVWLREEADMDERAMGADEHPDRLRAFAAEVERAALAGYDLAEVSLVAEGEDIARPLPGTHPAVEAVWQLRDRCRALEGAAEDFVSELCSETVERMEEPERLALGALRDKLAALDAAPAVPGGGADDEEDPRPHLDEIARLLGLDPPPHGFAIVAELKRRLAAAKRAQRALWEIAHPLEYLRAQAEQSGGRLDGGATVALLADAGVWRSHAQRALDAAPAPARESSGATAERARCVAVCRGVEEAWRSSVRPGGAPVTAHDLAAHNRAEGALQCAETLERLSPAPARGATVPGRTACAWCGKIASIGDGDAVAVVARRDVGLCDRCVDVAARIVADQRAKAAQPPEVR